MTREDLKKIIIQNVFAEEQILDAMIAAYNAGIEDAAENAKIVRFMDDCGYYETVDKEEILKLRIK